MSTQTLIQLKYSTANSAPSLLEIGEHAYSYVSNTLFIGTSDGTGVLKIGGQYYTDIVDKGTPLAVSSTLALRDASGSVNFNDVTANTLNSNTTIYAGLSYASPLGMATNPLIAGDANANNYSQIYVRNVNAGTKVSADLIAYPDNGTDTNGWVDVGITGSNFNDPDFSVTGPNEGYLFMSAPSGSSTSGNLVIATDSTGTYNAIEFYVGGFAQSKANAKVKIDTVGLTANTLTTNTFIQFPNGTTLNTANVLVFTAAAPGTNKGAAGDKKGYVYLANNYFYYCTADYDGTTNVWSRIAATDAW